MSHFTLKEVSSWLTWVGICCYLGACSRPQAGFALLDSLSEDPQVRLKELIEFDDFNVATDPKMTESHGLETATARGTFSTYDQANSRTIRCDSQGRLYYLGYTGPTLYRIVKSVELDTAFGTSTYAAAAPHGDSIRELTIGPNDKPIGVARVASVSDPYYELVRFNTTGNLDTSFATTGVLSVNPTARADFARAVESDAAGKIYVTGFSNASAHLVSWLARFTSAGSIDTSFATIGIAFFSLPGQDAGAYTVLPTANGIVVGGFARTFNRIAKTLTVRWNSNGSLDTGFTTTGYVVTQIGSYGDSYISRIRSAPSGGALSAGAYVRQALTPASFLTSRVSGNGSLDTLFNTTGVVLDTHNSGGNPPSVIALTTGQILGLYQNWVVRYSSSGTIQTDFAGFGSARDLAVTPTGLIYVVSGAGLGVADTDPSFAEIDATTTAGSYASTWFRYNEVAGGRTLGFTLTNYGTVDLTAASGTTGGPFIFAGGTYPGTGGDCGATIAAGTTCTLKVALDSTGSFGMKYGVVTVNYNNGLTTDSATANLYASVSNLTANTGDLLSVDGNACSGIPTTTTITLSNSVGYTMTGMTNGASVLTKFDYIGGSYPGTAGTCNTNLNGVSSCTLKIQYAPANSVSTHTERLEVVTSVPYDGVTITLIGNSVDDDDDGDTHTECAGDCDDTDNTIHPGATETCGDAVDQNCTGGNNDGCTDADNDGYYSTGVSVDCNESDSAIHPGATEICGDGTDQDCTGGNNNGCTDSDGDGYYTTGTNADCDDSAIGVNPGATEVCGDGTDQDCTGGNNNGCTDNDADGFYSTGTNTDCDEADPAVNPGTGEVCANGKDDDCSGAENNGCVDSDGDGYFSTGANADCDDSVGGMGINPGASEVCGDGTDQDCTGGNNNGCTDNDGDGYFTTGVSPDCDDNDIGVYPGNGCRSFPFRKPR